jgi:hypothetical protein
MSSQGKGKCQKVQKSKLDSSAHSRSRPASQGQHGDHMHARSGSVSERKRTLFAGFDLSFSKIFSDCCLLASPLILPAVSVTFRTCCQVACGLSSLLEKGPGFVVNCVEQRGDVADMLSPASGTTQHFPPFVAPCPELGGPLSHFRLDLVVAEGAPSASQCPAVCAVATEVPPSTSKQNDFEHPSLQAHSLPTANWSAKI